MASNQKKATRTTKRKTKEQNVAIVQAKETLSTLEYDNDNENQNLPNKESEYETDIDNKEQVSYKNNKLPSSSMTCTISNELMTNETIQNNNTGNTRQTGSMTESGAVTDCISIANRTESMSSITQEKAEIAAHVPELFHLKKFICSDAELVSTGKIASFFFKHMSIPQKYQEEWWAGAINKVRKSIDQKRATVAMSRKIKNKSLLIVLSN